MFTIVVLAKEQGKQIGDGFGFVKCICENSFSFDFVAKENCRRSGKSMILTCPICKVESSEVVVPRYTDEKGTVHGRMKYKLVYLGKGCLAQG